MNKISMIMLLVLCSVMPMSFAAYMGLNISVDGDMTYNGVMESYDQYNSVYMQTKDSHVDFSYWIDADSPNPEFDIEPVYNTNNYYSTSYVTSKTSNKQDIRKVIGEGITLFLGIKEDIYPSKQTIWFNSTLKAFEDHVISKVYGYFVKPTYQELEFIKRKQYYMEQDLKKINDLLSRFPELQLTARTDSYDCLAMKSMMKDGMISRGDCNNQTWIKDDIGEYIVTFKTGK